MLGCGFILLQVSQTLELLPTHGFNGIVVQYDNLPRLALAVVSTYNDAVIGARQTLAEIVSNFGLQLGRSFSARANAKETVGQLAMQPFAVADVRILVGPILQPNVILQIPKRLHQGCFKGAPLFQLALDSLPLILVREH